MAMCPHCQHLLCDKCRKSKPAQQTYITCCQCHVSNLERAWYHEALLLNGENIPNLFGRKVIGNA